MNTTKRKDSNKLERIIDTLVEDIDATSDESILEEAKTIFGNIDDAVESVRSSLEKAIADVGKKRLIKARAELQSTTSEQPSNVLSLPLDRKKEILRNIESSGQDITLAARKEEELTETDFDAKLEALIELGLIDKDGNSL